MRPPRSPIAATGLSPLRWADIGARREQAGPAWPSMCPLCREPFPERDEDVRWLAEHGRLLTLPDGCAAHRYCAVENPHRDPARIMEHECDPASERDTRVRGA